MEFGGKVMCMTGVLFSFILAILALLITFNSDAGDDRKNDDLAVSKITA